jgi:hypothetical protein
MCGTSVKLVIFATKTTLYTWQQQWQHMSAFTIRATSDTRLLSKQQDRYAWQELHKPAGTWRVPRMHQHTTSTCLMRFCRLSEPPGTTMVIRERPSVSLVPTASDCTLKPRRANTPVTSFRQPGLSSTYNAERLSLILSWLILPGSMCWLAALRFPREVSSAQQVQGRNRRRLDRHLNGQCLCLGDAGVTVAGVQDMLDLHATSCLRFNHRNLAASASYEWKQGSKRRAALWLTILQFMMIVVAARALPTM